MPLPPNRPPHPLQSTTGGTGFAPRDVTPEATQAILHKTAAGLMTAVVLVGPPFYSSGTGPVTGTLRAPGSGYGMDTGYPMPPTRPSLPRLSLPFPFPRHPHQPYYLQYQPHNAPKPPPIAVHGLQESMKVEPLAMLSRAVAGVRHRTLIINLPGRPNAVRQNLQILLPVLGHAVQQADGQG